MDNSNSEFVVNWLSSIKGTTGECEAYHVSTFRIVRGHDRTHRVIELWDGGHALGPGRYHVRATHDETSQSRNFNPSATVMGALELVNWEEVWSL